MSISDLLLQGLQLVLTGMGLVFAFLGLLIIVVSSMTRLLGLSPAEVVAAESTVAADVMSDPELVSVISAAIHNYRRQRRPARDT